ncbi:hypothetical protein X801_09377 [Opisthorchis viverrini]|nr:hypothetical protein X801_09377 [Opisthorchis viverrini]
MRLSKWFSSFGVEKQLILIQLGVLVLSAVIGRYESVIHEFDPYFNYRTTRYMTKEGFYSFHDWFDEMAWYPLGRIIGGTIYPGTLRLM